MHSISLQRNFSVKLVQGQCIQVIKRYVFMHILELICMHVHKSCQPFTLIRPGKLNSQFIVTNFSVLHAGGRSLFRFHISYRVFSITSFNMKSE